MIRNCHTVSHKHDECSTRTENVIIIYHSAEFYSSDASSMSGTRTAVSDILRQVRRKSVADSSRVVCWDPGPHPGRTGGRGSEGGSHVHTFKHLHIIHSSTSYRIIRVYNTDMCRAHHAATHNTHDTAVRAIYVLYGQQCSW